MKKEFSLKYGDKEYRFSPDGTSYNLGDGVTVQTQLTEYTDFDAVEWVLHFENNVQLQAVMGDIHNYVKVKTKTVPLKFLE